MPHVAEDILANGHADMVSMARPFLADPHFVNKAAENKADEINTCIGCNQACLDHTFKGIKASCLVNPIACHEDEFDIKPTEKREKVRPQTICGRRQKRSGGGGSGGMKAG